MAAGSLVEERSRRDRLAAAAERLLEVDPDALDRILAAAEAVVAAYDQPSESEAKFRARCALICKRPSNGEAN